MISLKEETFLFVFEMLIKFNFKNLMQKPLENDEQNLSKVSVKLRWNLDRLTCVTFSLSSTFPFTKTLKISAENMTD